MYTNPRISDSIATNRDYAERAKALGHSLISTMEHGWQGRYIEGYDLAKEYGLKFLFGTEAYWVKDRAEKDRSNCHIFIGAKNDNGRRAINDVLSEANLTGFYGQARLDIPLIMSLPEDDVWVTTACIAYWRYDDIEKITEEFARKFKNNFFLEVQYHNTPSQIELNKRILTLRDRLKVPLIMGCDSHYIQPSGAGLRTDFLLSKEMKYPDEEGWYLDYPDGDTAYKRFAEQSVLTDAQIREAMDNTNVFLDVKEYESDIFNKDIKMISLYPDKTQEEKDEIYKSIVRSAWREERKNIPEELHPVYLEEIKKEVQTVVDTHTADYFIDNYHIIRRGKELGGQLTLTGRGSAVSFYTNKLLGFTDVDRIAAKVKMYPERFMSTERILQSGSLPDIDFNCANVELFAKAQQEILGEDHAYPMLSYNTVKKSAAWKLYAKAQNVPFEIANEVSKQLQKYELAVKHADDDEKEYIDVHDYIDHKYHEVYDGSKAYLGLISSWSIAPCSYLLYQGSIRKEVGLVKIKDHICCAMDGHWAEANHFFKNDLLKVSVVDLIYRVFDEIGEKPLPVSELLSKCTPDDPAWDVYKKGCTMSVNQVEKTATSARAGKYKPTNISELCAFVAAIRPGGASFYKNFESRKPFAYGIKAFDELVQTEEMPYSYLLYQEQVMRALNYAGMDMADCYTAIKNIAKKRAEKVLAYKDTFIEGFKNAIIRDEGKTPEEAQTLAENLWAVVEDSAGYLFNSSHSYCVSLDSLYCAYLKTHYPLDFYKVAIKIQDEKGDKDKMMTLKEEAESYFNVKFLPLRYGQDNRDITVDRNTSEITSPLSSVKGFGASVGKIMYECSQLGFSDFIDVLDWLSKRSIKYAKVEPLIKIGYFNRFGNDAELLRVARMFDEVSAKKTLPPDTIPEEFRTEEFFEMKKKDGEPLKNYRIKDPQHFIKTLEQYIYDRHIPDLDYRVKAENQKDILGYVDLTTGDPADRKKLFVLEVYSLPDRFNGGIWKYKVKVKSIGSGRTSSLDVSRGRFEVNPIKEGDIITEPSVIKDDKGYWRLTRYNII